MIRPYSREVSARTFAVLLPLLTTLLLSAPAAAQLTASFDVTSGTGPAPLLVSFTDTSTGGVVIGWIWDFGDGTGSNSQNPTHQYNAPGSYDVSLLVIGAGFASDQVTQVDAVTVGEGFVAADFTIDVTQGALPLDVQFTDLSTGSAAPNAWSWNFGDGKTTSQQNPVHTYTQPGTYTVTLKAKLQYWPLLLEDTLVQQDLVIVEPVDLTADFTASVTAGVNPLAVQFSDTSTGVVPTKWAWDFGDGESSTQQHPIHVYDEPGVFDVSLTVWYFGQSDQVAQPGLVTVGPAPIDLGIAGLPAAGIPPVAATLVARWSGTEPSFYSWAFGDGSFESFEFEGQVEHAWLAPGLYDVALTSFIGEQFDTVVAPAAVRVGPFGGRYLRTAALSLGNVPGSAGVRVAAHRGRLLGAGYSNPFSAEAVLWRRGASGDWVVETTFVPGSGSVETFGYDVDLSARLALIGAPSWWPAQGAGEAWLHARGEDGWEPVATLTSTEVVAGEGFGMAVAVADAAAVVGAPDAADPLAGSGRVFVHEPGPDDAWDVVTALSQPGGAEEQARFGWAVEVEGARLAVGAPRADGALVDEGLVFLFERQADGVWLHVATIASPGPTQDSGFGWALALDGDRLLVGAPAFDSQGAPNAGAAYLFERSPSGSWQAVARLQPEVKVGALSSFGVSVALRQGHALVGASTTTTTHTTDGAAFSFVRSLRGDWEQEAALYSSSPDPWRFGTDVALPDGALAVTGRADEPSMNSGLVEVLEAVDAP